MENYKAGVVAFAFGKPANSVPNNTLASIAITQAEELETGIYTEPDINIRTASIATEEFKPTAGKHPSTLQMARCAVDWAMKNNYNKLIVVATTPHMWRCVRDLKIASSEKNVELIIESSLVVYQYPKDYWFAGTSTQVRTRSQGNWFLYDLALRLTPVPVYKWATG